MEHLLRQIVEQNDVLINQNERKLGALSEVLNRLDGMYSQLILNDVSSEVSTVAMHLREAVTQLEDVVDKLDTMSDKFDEFGDKLGD